MRILCDVTVLNNLQPQASVKHGKATLAISWHPPNKENSELFLILFTNKNKHQSSQKFRMKDNLAQVFNRFAHEGKLTLAFKEPNQSLQIRTDPVQLKSFLSTMKLAMNCSKEDRNKIGLSTVAVQAIATKAHPVTKLTILNRGDFPTKGLPRTLTHLQINGIGRCRIDMQIVYLKQLQVLNVSDNCIAKVPKAIGDLCLRELDLRKNDLGSPETGCDWKWLRGANLQRSLKTLDLSENKLPAIPLDLFKFRSLSLLALDGNQIRNVPFGIRKMTSLKHFSISKNCLESLNTALDMITLDSLDVSLNNLSMQRSSNNPTREWHVTFPSLFEISARVVELKRLFYSPETIPVDIMDLLFYTPVCRCGKICFNSEIHRNAVPLQLRHRSLTTTVGSLYGDAVFCSLNCQNILRRH